MVKYDSSWVMSSRETYVENACRLANNYLKQFSIVM